jgi:REP element-mobilizing transposase RayT
MVDNSNAMARHGRIFLQGGGCYHCYSRIVEKAYRFRNDREKRYFLTTMRKLEAFLGVRVLTFCIMSNHFHLLVEVPTPDAVERLTLESLRAKLATLYSGRALALARDEIDRVLASGSQPWKAELLSRYQARMGNLSVFLKELKQRFTQWYNGANDRVGTLWERRFGSVAVEADERALMTMAAYIDLNPVRAGIVQDPADYIWCGYGEAMAGREIARKNLGFMYQRTKAWQSRGGDWRRVGPVYRSHLFGLGERREADEHTGRGGRTGIDPAVVQRVVAKEGGEVPLHILLRCRVRYFCSGALFGSRDFVEQVFREQRERFGPRRTSGARKMRGAAWGGLAVLRDLRKDVFGRETDSE